MTARRANEMLDAVFNFLFEVIAFHLGQFYLRVLTFGRFSPSIHARSQPLVSLFGALFTLVLLIAIGIGINRY
jgi:hypothetical protein